MKKCSRCNINREFKKFTKRKLNLDGYSGVCKQCRNDDKIKYRKTVKGLITGIYQRQIYSSEWRNHNPPTYTRNELQEWILSQPNFVKLYNNWVKSGYQKDSKPSVDRLDDYKGYIMDNIQLMTWKENKVKHYEDIRNGINKKTSKAVNKYDLNGNFIEDYFSMKNASDKTDTLIQSISKCCNNKLKTAGGFIWKLS